MTLPGNAPPAPPTQSEAPARRGADAEPQALFVAISDVILVLAAEGRYVKIAPTTAALPYRPAPELLGKTLHDVFDRAQADEFLGLIHRALERRETVQAEYCLPIGGRDVWFAAAISPMAGERVVVVARGVSDPTPAVEGLRGSEERFRALVEHSTEVITLLDAEGTVLYARQSSQPVLGYAATENVGRSAFELVHPDDRPQALELFAELRERPGRLVRTELRALHKNGTWRHLETAAMNRLDEPAVGAIAVNYRHITQRKPTDQDLPPPAPVPHPT